MGDNNTDFFADAFPEGPADENLVDDFFSAKESETKSVKKTPKSPSAKKTPAAAKAPLGIARHATLKKRNPAVSVLKFVGAAVVVAVGSTAALAGLLVTDVVSDLKVVELESSVDIASLPAIGSMEGGTNILIVGSDKREGQSGFGELNDVTMLVHIAEDKSSAVAVSFPRDLIVPIPSCPNPSGGRHGAMSAQPINVTLSYGGLPCTVLTVEALTGLSIPYAAMVTFNGVIAMSNAIGGVEVCVQSPIRDRESRLYLDPGTHNIKGAEALAFLRTRKGVGDGSDLSRIGMQQSFLSSLIRTVKSNDTLTDLNKLYGLATAATQNMTLSASLGGFDTMVSLALTLKELDMSKISFVTYPGSTGSVEHPGKVIPNKFLANELFQMIKADKAIIPVADNTGQGTVSGGTSGSEKPTISSGIHGQTADAVTCAAGR
ncbi:MAG: LCP family protein [Microbacteriaceae bacterium]